VIIVLEVGIARRAAGALHVALADDKGAAIALLPPTVSILAGHGARNRPLIPADASERAAAIHMISTFDVERSHNQSTMAKASAAIGADRIPSARLRAIV
jgi:hypothetical protein